MELIKANISGKNVSAMSDQLKEILVQNFPGLYFQSIGFVNIFTFEKFFFRINSNVLTVITIDYSDNNKIDIEVITGGGAVGLLGITWWAEEKGNDNVINLFNEFCKKNSFQFYFVI